MCGGAIQFGSSNTTTAKILHTNSLPLIPNLLKYMDGYLNNMVNAVTNKKDVLGQLIMTNTKQADRSMPSRNVAQPTLPPQLSTTYSASTARKLGNNVDYQEKGGYCWPHGYRVHPRHSSLSCTKYKDDHKENATHANITNTLEYNKGWHD